MTETIIPPSAGPLVERIRALGPVRHADAVALVEAYVAAEVAQRARMEGGPYVAVLPQSSVGVVVGGRFSGWQANRHPDGYWVTVRKLPEDRTFGP